MSDIHLEKNHPFDFATARTQAKKWLAEVNERLGVNIDYKEGTDKDTATIKKSGVEARAILTADKIIFEADLAFLAKPLKPMITSGIQEGLDKFFQKA